MAVVLAGAAAALAAGPHRLGALLGVGLAGVTGLLSILSQGWLAGSGSRGVQQALLVNVVGFLLRMLLLVPAVFLVVRLGGSAAGFVVGFFVIYFALFGIEGAYVQRLGRRAGSSA
jgi:hypothetical protein